jgi:4-hydroxybenzoate polyprenyltransferase
MGIILVIFGFFYSWNGYKLKSKPLLDMVSHVIFMGEMQFLITYLAFRPLELMVAPFLMIIVPFSVMNEIIQEMRDFEIDKRTNIENSVQKLEGFNIKNIFLGLSLIVLFGFSLVLYNFINQNNYINLLITSSVGITAFYRLYSQVSRRTC